MKLFDEVLQLYEQKKPFVLAIVVNTTGSTPGHLGRKMIVKENGDIVGTIGGGKVEKLVIDESLHLLKNNGKPKVMPFSLTEAFGYMCGGEMLVYLEPFFTSKQLIIFGGGHVGKALCYLGHFTGFSCIVIDDRPEFANKDQLPFANTIILEDYLKSFDKLSLNNSFIVITTRDHEIDYQIIKRSLKSEAKYIGAIGSKKKKNHIFTMLKQEGFSDKDLERIHCPIGIPIKSETPEEIAVSIIAEIIDISKSGI